LLQIHIHLASKLYHLFTGVDSNLSALLTRCADYIQDMDQQLSDARMRIVQLTVEVQSSKQKVQHHEENEAALQSQVHLLLLSCDLIYFAFCNLHGKAHSIPSCDAPRKRLPAAHVLACLLCNARQAHR